MINKNKRLIGLDFLRGIAVLLVLFHHSKAPNIFSNYGWLGVDLFFVLSGFLVSGILYREIISTGTLNPCKFLIRRAFKIYPAFYIFLFVTISLKLYFIANGSSNQQFQLKQILSEIFFIQNYIKPLWNHTWSLAVEEHFYILLLIFFFYGVKTGLINYRLRTRLCYIFLIILCFILRFIIVSSGPINLERNYYPTHVRIDSLFFGVLLADFYYFDNISFTSFFKKRLLGLIILSVFLLTPVLLFDRYSNFNNTIGYLLIFLSFGIVISIFITHEGANNFKFLFRGNLTYFLPYIGYYSYSIYLWHMIVVKYIMPFIQNRYDEYYIPSLFWIGLYIFISVILGIFLSKIIEYPSLRLRERYFSIS